MLIGFCGSHGTGKTTTAQAVSDKTHLTFHGSTARQVSAAGWEVNQEATPLSQMLVTVSRINQLGAVHRTAATAVTDRTPLDSLAYSYYQAEHVWKDMSPNQKKLYLAESLNVVQTSMKMYDKIFYFPVFWAPEDDGLRKVDENYQHEIADTIMNLLGMMAVQAVIVPNLSVEERVSVIKKACNVV